MITEIIDLFVDASNTLGSLFEALVSKYRNYRNILTNTESLNSSISNDILEKIPEIKNEMLQSGLIEGFVVIVRIKTKNEKSSLEIALLDSNCRYRHSFNILKRHESFFNCISAPCYFRFNLQN